MECETSNRRVGLSSPELAELKRKLRSEFGPSVLAQEGADREELRKVLVLADRDLEEHEAQYQQLVLQRAALQSLLSPIRRLPNETLLHIFEYVCDENLLQSYPWFDSKNPPPTKLTSPTIVYLPAMAISSVCFRWRELALSSPGLWAGLTVETCTISTARQARPFKLARFISTLDLFLERSGDWPLRLALDIRGDKEMDDSLAHLTRHSHRWRTLKLQHQKHPSTAFHIFSNLQFPSLTKLDLPFLGQAGGLDHFKHSPKLRSLVGLVGNQGLENPNNRVLFHRLHHVEFQMDHEEDLYHALRQCPSLKSLGLKRATTFNFWSRAPPKVEGGVVWPDITSLIIGESLVQSLVQSLQYTASNEVFLFSFPSLKELQVERLDRPVASNTISWPRDAFISFVSRSSCTITTFTVRGVSLADIDLIASLRVMPSLLHLEVDDKSPTRRFTSPTHQSPITPHFLASLILGRSNETLPNSLVPKLHSLCLVFYGTTFDDWAFVSMVESRWFKPGSNLHTTMLAMGIGCIRSVVLKFFQRNFAVESYKPLWVLDKEGLRVTTGWG